MTVMAADLGGELSDAIAERYSEVDLHTVRLKWPTHKVYRFNALDGRPVELEIKQHNTREAEIILHHNSTEACMYSHGDHSVESILRFITHALGEE